MIIPSLDYIKGNIVRLYQGNYKKIIFYKKNIFHQIKKYHMQGAKYIHLVDLDGCQNINKRQMNIIQKIMCCPIRYHLQLGGGIRNTTDISQLLDCNISRVVIGTSAILQKKEFIKWLRIFGNEKIVLAIDIVINKYNNKEISISGWRKKTGFYLENVLNDLIPFGLKHVLCTDISKDGTLLGPNINLYAELVYKFPSIMFQASGGVSSLEDIKNLKKIGISSIIVGKALLEKRFTLLEAIECWQKG